MTYNEFREKYAWVTVPIDKLTEHQWVVARTKEPEFFAANYNGEPVLPEWEKEELEVWGDVCQLGNSVGASLGTRFAFADRDGGNYATGRFVIVFADYPEWNKLPSYVWERALKEVPGAAAFAVLMV